MRHETYAVLVGRARQSTLPATMPPTPSSRYQRLLVRRRGSCFCTVMLMRAHTSKAGDTDHPAGRTLFLINVPAACTSDMLKMMLSTFGNVRTVTIGMLAPDSADILSGEITGSRTAHVVFKSPVALEKALASDECLALVGGSSDSTKTGKATSEECSREELQTSVETFMKKFEADEARRIREAEAAHNRMDADGFVVVTRKRKGRNTSTDGEVTVGAASDAASAARAAKRAKKKRADTIDFYQFQRHERKREQLTKLREQFEADRARIAKMRLDRKFKPL